MTASKGDTVSSTTDTATNDDPTKKSTVKQPSPAEEPSPDFLSQSQVNSELEKLTLQKTQQHLLQARPQNGKRLTLRIHGYNGSAETFSDAFNAHLDSVTYSQATGVTFVYDSTRSWVALVDELHWWILEQQYHTQCGRVLLVAHSCGGCLILRLLQRYYGIYDYRAVLDGAVFVDSPINGIDATAIADEIDETIRSLPALAKGVYDRLNSGTVARNAAADETTRLLNGTANDTNAVAPAADNGNTSPTRRPRGSLNFTSGGNGVILEGWNTSDWYSLATTLGSGSVAAVQHIKELYRQKGAAVGVVQHYLATRAGADPYSLKTTDQFLAMLDVTPEILESYRTVLEALDISILNIHFEKNPYNFLRQPGSDQLHQQWRSVELKLPKHDDHRFAHVDAHQRMFVPPGDEISNQVLRAIKEWVTQEVNVHQQQGTHATQSREHTTQTSTTQNGSTSTANGVVDHSMQHNLSPDCTLTT